MLARPTRRLPSQPDLTQMLRGLLGRDVTLSKVPPEEGPKYVAVYHDHGGAAVNAVTVDVALAATLSASLALVPVGQAEEWVAAGSLPEDAVENAYEVLNVLAAAHNGGDEARHVKLATLLAPDDDVPAGVAAGVAAPTAGCCYQVDVAGYPSGRLATAAF